MNPLFILMCAGVMGASLRVPTEYSVWSLKNVKVPATSDDPACVLSVPSGGHRTTHGQKKDREQQERGNPTYANTACLSRIFKLFFDCRPSIPNADRSLASAVEHIPKCRRNDLSTQWTIGRFLCPCHCTVLVVHVIAWKTQGFFRRECIMADAAAGLCIRFV